MLATVGAVLCVAMAGCPDHPQSAADAHESDPSRAGEELADAAQVLHEMDQIAYERRMAARCVAVVPSLVRAGFIVGGRHGDGVVSCRTPSGWSGPVFITVTGGSAGLQVGIESSDVVMLIMSERAMGQFFRSSFSIGADASASAGPVGKATQAGTDASLRVEILSYARSRGLFAGAELTGAVVRQDSDALVAMYGASPSVPRILAGESASPPQARGFLSALEASFGTQSPSESK